MSAAVTTPKLVRQTWALLAVLLAVLVVDVAVHVESEVSAGQHLPVLPAIDPAKIAKITLTHGDDTLIFERESAQGEWQMTAPVSYPADRASVQAVALALRSGVPMDVQVDSGNLDKYGLVQPDVVLVELTDKDGNRLAAYYVGNNAAGGSTFVRLPDSDAVYRAKVGGRTRYDKPAPEWRDHMITNVEPTTIVGVTVQTPTMTIGVSRDPATKDEKGRPQTKPWRLDGKPGFPLDQPAADDLANAVAHVRAGDILPADKVKLGAPAATVTVRVEEGEPIVLVLTQTPDGLFAKKEGATEVFRVAPSLLDKVTRDEPRWRDRQLFQLTWQQIARMSLVQPTVTTTVQQDPKALTWSVVEPPNVVVDPKEMSAIARGVSTLRADDVSDVPPAQAGFPGKEKLVITMADGKTYTLEIGAAVPNQPQGQEAVYARTSDAPERVTIIAAAAMSRIEKAFAR